MGQLELFQVPKKVVFTVPRSFLTSMVDKGNEFSLF